MSFLSQISKIVNTGQARSIILSGDIYDLFFDGTKYVPLVDLLVAKCKAERMPQQKGITQILYRNNSPITVIGDDNMFELESSWRLYHDDGKSLKQRLAESHENSVYAFELLRQIAECNRRAEKTNKNNLLIIIENADMHLPECEINRMSPTDRRRISIVQDWFADPEFLNSHDSVILLSELRSDVHKRISKLPQVVSVEVPLPDVTQRGDFIKWLIANRTTEIKDDTTPVKLAQQTSGLSLHAVRQLVLSGDFGSEAIAAKVEEYIVAQLGEGVIEFKRPSHTLDKVFGFKRVKQFLREQLIPAFLADGDGSISGAAVAGPIGGGKTFICEAVAAEIGIPVIVLKNIRSKWYGETDQIFERLRQILESFHKIVIFVDEADTMFGDVNSDQDTERRLTGKIQSMMSDPRLKGRVIWFLMTARIHRLSADIRRPGRMDLIIPILDPEAEDLEDFLKWTLGSLAEQVNHDIRLYTSGWSAASFAALRNRIKLEKCTDIKDVVRIANDIVSPDIEDVRRYQTLQAKVNTTRRILLVPEDLPNDRFCKMRSEWKEQILELERKGVK